MCLEPMVLHVRGASLILFGDVPILERRGWARYPSSRRKNCLVSPGRQHVNMGTPFARLQDGQTCASFRIRALSLRAKC